MTVASAPIALSAVVLIANLLVMSPPWIRIVNLAPGLRRGDTLVSPLHDPSGGVPISCLDRLLRIVCNFTRVLFAPSGPLSLRARIFSLQEAGDRWPLASVGDARSSASVPPPYDEA